jgi:quercetin dioxygenase-like cupin family protein
MRTGDQDRKRELARLLLEKLRPLARKLERTAHFPAIQTHGPQIFSYCCIERERLARISSDVPRIGIVLSGQKEFWLGVESQSFGAGDVFVLPADVAFDVVNIPSETSGLY